MDHVETYDLNSNVWTTNSNKWYRNDGVYNNIGLVYDVTKNNNDMVFSSLSELLNSPSLSALIPVKYRTGGMSIRFIQSSDNKYVQYRLMSQSWSINVNDWTSGESEFATGEKVSKIGIDDEPTTGSENLVKSRGVYTSLKELESETKTKITEVTSDLITLQNVIQDIDGDTLYVTDADGNVIAKINNQGIESVDISIKDGKKLSETPNDVLENFYKKQLYVSDSNGNVVLNIDEKGNLHYVGDDILVHNDWWNKIISTYGDSVVAVNNGDFTYPYSFDSVGDSWNWGNRVAQYYKMSKHYGRGIGGQGYKWTTAKENGGSVAFVNTTSGSYAGRDDNYNYDNYAGEIPEGCVKVRGCLASWGRITAMYPASIKDTIDVILVMAHNDAYDTSECTFVPNDTTDPEWAASGADYYDKINGDYDLTTLKGGIASTLMKLQLWMPNAIIVLLSGISGQGTTGKLNTDINGGLKQTAQAIREMSHLTSIPCIDTFATDGINGWNRTTYIADSIHPYTVVGSKMFARSVIGGLKGILPHIK